MPRIANRPVPTTPLRELGGVTIRLAGRADVAALVALRGLMFTEMGADPVEVANAEWQLRSSRWLQLRVTTDRMRAVVAEAKGAVVSSAVGTVVEAAPTPANPTGQIGMLSNAATFPSYKDRGLGEACVQEVVHWFLEDTNVGEIEVLASPQRREIYDRLGFTVDEFPQMRLRLQR